MLVTNDKMWFVLIDCSNHRDEEQLESSLEWRTHAICSTGFWAHKVGKFVYNFYDVAFEFSIHPVMDPKLQE